MWGLDVEGEIRIDWCLQKVEVMVVIEEVREVLERMVQFLRIGKNGVRISFVERMNKAQEYLLHDMVGMRKFLGVE